MKKEYGTPKAEKVTFDYSEVVVASGTICEWSQRDGKQDEGCNTSYIGEGTWNEAAH